MIQFVKDKGGIEYAESVMNTYHKDAINILNEFPPSPSRTSLEQLVQYTIDRNK